MNSEDGRGLTLYEIESGITEMVEVREAATTPEELAAADQAIAAYVGEELRKVDGIRGYIRNAEAAIAAAKEEAARQTERAQVWISRIANLKRFCLAVMQQNGLKRLEGRTGTIAVHGNGGAQPLVLPADESLVPETYALYTVVVPGRIWRPMYDTFPDSFQRCQHVRDLDHAAIRAALLAGKEVAGCRLEERGKHLSVK